MAAGFTLPGQFGDEAADADRDGVLTPVGIAPEYGKLAREFHPDVNKDPGAEDRFKEIAEAYEVLGEAEKREQYDSIGKGYSAGQEFKPPPGWEHGAGTEYEYRTAGDFSDFFDPYSPIARHTAASTAGSLSADLIIPFSFPKYFFSFRLPTALIAATFTAVWRLVVA